MICFLGISCDVTAAALLVRPDDAERPPSECHVYETL